MRNHDQDAYSLRVLFSRGCFHNLQGGYTAHLDLDTGTLKGLEAAAGDFTTNRARRGGFSDATPHLPSILSAQFKRQQGRAETQELAGIKGNNDDMAKEGMHTECTTSHRR